MTWHPKMKSMKSLKLLILTWLLPFCALAQLDMYEVLKIKSNRRHSSVQTQTLDRTFTHNETLYFTVLSRDKDTTRLYGFNTQSDQHALLVTIPQNTTFNHSFIAVGNKAFYVCNHGSPSKIDVLELSDLNAPTSHRPIGNLTFSKARYAVGEREVFYFGTYGGRKGTYLFNSKSKKFQRISEKYPGLLQTLGDSCLMTKLISTDLFIGTDSANLVLVDKPAMSAVVPGITTKNAAYFVHNTTGMDHVYKITKGKTGVEWVTKADGYTSMHGTEGRLYMKVWDDRFGRFTYGLVRDPYKAVFSEDNTITVIPPTDVASNHVAAITIDDWGDGALFMMDGRTGTSSSTALDTVYPDPRFAQGAVGHQDHHYFVGRVASKRNGANRGYFLCQVDTNKNLKMVSSPLTSMSYDNVSSLISVGGSIYLFNGTNNDIILRKFIDKAVRIQFNGFNDLNENGSRDIGEPIMRNFKARLKNHTADYQSDAKGEVLFPFTAGDYEFDVKTSTYWKITTESTVIVSADMFENKDEITFDVGFAKTKSVTEVEGVVSNARARCGRDTWLRPKIINSGTENINGSIKLSIPTALVVDSFDIEPDSSNNNVYYWSFTEITPSDYRMVKAFISLEGTRLGASYTYDAIFTGEGPEEQKSSSKEENTLTVRCSFDPNDKTVWPANEELQGQTLFGEALTYRIRFQNTGNDTAYDVVILDTLSEYLDWSTFRILDQSHPMESKFYDDGTVEFTFNNIMLPDSNVNEPESHGFVTYRIMPDSGLAEKTPIRNTAHIIFDVNDPVRTNTTENIMVSGIVSISEQNTNKPSSVSIYPNPSRSLIHVVLENDEPTIAKITSMDGRTLKDHLEISSGNPIDVSQLPRGMFILTIRQGTQSFQTSFVKQ